jgi:hypothetical protein
MSSLLYKILYLVLMIISLTIINWTWVQKIGNGVSLRDVYLYDITQVEGKPIGDQVIYFSSLSIVIGTSLLFYVDSNFRYYDVILGYLIWKMIPFISSPINIA